MNQGDKVEEHKIVHFPASVVYQSDPLARLLIERLKLRKHTAALAAVVWSLTFLFFLPAISGSLWSTEEYLGSLKDWHAQLLLLLVFPATCAFYVWQPSAIAGVYEAILSGHTSHDLGRPYRRGTWRYLSLLLALAVVLFDAPKMIASYGSWWMAHNYLTIAAREASLAVAFYMVSMIAWRQVIATVEWNRLLAKASSATMLRAVADYGLSCAFVLALFGLRLSAEGIELPQRAGAITPDFYVKIAIYIMASLACFFVPLGGLRREGIRISLFWVITLLRLAGIMALPLLAFVVLKLIL